MALNNPPLDNVSIIYHGGCQDGFGAAFAAWKKYGAQALYTTAYHGLPYPKEAVTNKNVVMIDFSYKKEVLDEVASLAQSLTILDHHKSAAEAIQSIPSSLYDIDHSGAYLAWKYFHPATEIPRLIAYIEDDDLYRFVLPDSRAVREYVFSKPFDFEVWDAVMKELESEEGYERIVQVGSLYREYAQALIVQLANAAELVSFDGYEVLAVAAPRLFDSEVGHLLAERKPPFGMLFKFEIDRVRVSLRGGNGAPDLSEIATRYGGGGHAGAAGFTIEYGKPLPFKKIARNN